MSLITLPNELLTLILECVLPADIENFSLVCSRVHKLSHKMMRQHRQLKLRYSHIQVSKATLPSTLTDYCTGSYRLALYPTVLDIRPWDLHSPGNQIPSGTLDQLCAMAERTGLIPDHKVRQWFAEISSTDLAITPFLLPNLPNLQILRLHGPKREGLQCIEDFINAVVELQRRSENPQVLSKLSTLILFNHHPGQPTDLKYFLPFMQLPSLRNVHCTAMDYRSLERSPFPPRSSLVERLTLTQSTVSPRSFSILIGSFKALKFILYIPSTRDEFDPLAMRKALLEHHRHTLEELQIYSRQPPQGFMGPLLGFTALKVVKLNCHMLVDGGHMSRLVQSFPSSIERIEIEDGLDDEEEGRFFEYFDLRKSCVPNLKLVQVSGARPWEFPEPEDDFLFIYRNFSLTLMGKMMGWYGLDARGKWTRVGLGLNRNILTEDE